jgi:hypothetical protein
MTEFNVQPKEFVETTIVNKIDITEVEVKLYKGAYITVLLYTDSNRLYKCVRVEISHEEYANWGTDDNYIRDLVCQKLGFVLPN